MGQLVDFFYNQPNKVFQIRELERLSNIPKTTVSRKLNLLVNEKLVVRVDNGFIANESSKSYRFKKKLYAFEKIYNSGLVEFLEGFHPRTIVLFGSFSKGEFNYESDIDLFVECKSKNLDLSKYEAFLGHKISLFFDEDINNLSSELLANIINGIKLSGYIRIKEQAV